MRFLCVFFVFFGVCHMDCGAMTTGRCLYSRHRVGVSMVRLVCLPISVIQWAKAQRISPALTKGTEWAAH